MRAMVASLHTMQANALDDGVLNVHKQSGWTSHDVVAKLRGLLRVRRVGHAGTLDPSATGVLPVLLGRATRIAEYLIGWNKEYRAVLRLGEDTDTQDATGKVIARRSTGDVSMESIHATVGQFRGTIRQLPPMYSAVKVGGMPLYRAARAGRIVERGVREVTVHELEVVDISGSDVALRVGCSKGTYIRTLCADIGQALGVGGHLLSLERSRVGPLTIDRALTLEQIQSRRDRGELQADLMSLDAALAGMPAGILDEITSTRVLHGVPVPLSAIRWEDAREGIVHLAGRTVRLKAGSGRLLALGTVPAEIVGDREHAEFAQPVLPVVKVLAGLQDE